jgi:hypothetical protein
MRAHHLRALGLIGQKIVHFRNSAVEHRDLKSVVIHVQDEILSHNGEADQANVTTGVWHTNSGGELPHAFCAFPEG